MLRARHAALALVPMIAVGYVACASQDAGDDPNTSVDSAAIAAKPPILGTFRDEHSPGGVALLTLKSDYTFHLEEAVVCVRYPCVGPQLNGNYAYTRRSGVSLLVLFDADSRGVRQFKYKLSGDTLYLIPSESEGSWQALARSDRPWCAEIDDCELQGLPPPVCGGAWTCASNICSYQCGPVQSVPLGESDRAAPSPRTH